MGDIGAGCNFIADSSIELDNIVVEIEQHHNNLHRYIGIVEEIILEGAHSKEVNEVDNLKK